MIFAAACSCSPPSEPDWQVSWDQTLWYIPAAPPILEDPSNSRPLCFPLIQRPFVWWLHICYQNSLIPAAPSIQRIHQTSDHPAFPCFKYPLYDGCIYGNSLMHRFHAHPPSFPSYSWPLWVRICELNYSLKELMRLTDFGHFLPSYLPTAREPYCFSILGGNCNLDRIHGT